MKLKNFFRKIFTYIRSKQYGLEFPIHCKVHGVKYADRQGALAQSRAQDELQLVHIPLEDFPFNVYVYSIELNRILGYLDEYLSKKLVWVFGSGFCLDGTIDEIKGGPPAYKYYGCTLVVLDSMKMMLPYLDAGSR